MKKKCVGWLVICVLTLFVGQGGGNAAGIVTPNNKESKPPSISTNAEGAAMIDVTSGRLLYSHNGDKPMRIASLTKIMTAIVAIEQGKLSDLVTVSANAFGKEGSSIYLKLGQEMSLHYLLYGLMLRSGNDAATAIAEHIGGSLEGFTFLMNDKAQQIGMSRSHFANPHGLDDSDDHYSTANDMAKLTAYALQNPIFRDIVKTEIKKVPNPGENWDHVWANKNKMLFLYPGADGVKTGYTKLAKRCLVSSATHGNQQLAVVTLNDGDDWADHSRLLNYGFKYYPLQPLMNNGESLERAQGEANANVVAGRSVYYPLSEQEQQQISRVMMWHQPESLAYRLGEIGQVKLMFNGQAIATVPLYTAGSTKLKWDDAPAFNFQYSEFEQQGSKRFSTVLRRVLFTIFTI